MLRHRRDNEMLPPTPDAPENPARHRNRIALLVALAVMTGAATLLVGMGATFLMPGPMASGHGSIEKCQSCHTRSGSGKLSWIHGLVIGDPLADSKACIACHKMTESAFNPHGAPAAVLKQSTERLTKAAAVLSAPTIAARAQSVAFPTGDVMAGGIACATCHKEHRGTSIDLRSMSNERCQSCHALKFDRFDGHHPKFEGYPFKRRTRIVYDHAGHFGKHFPEAAKKDPARVIPTTCSDCHDSRDDKRYMAIKPFEQTCARCHLDQIKGKERVSGPKGIAFLALPGIDLQTMQKRKAPIGEWPDGSDAALTPFMKTMIGRDKRGRALIAKVDKLDLQDLASASEDDIKAVTELVWDIKKLFHSLNSGQGSAVLAHLVPANDGTQQTVLASALTAGLPRDVIVAAQQRWLPNLAAEISQGPGAVTPPSRNSAALAPREQPADTEADAASAGDEPSKSETAVDASAAGGQAKGEKVESAQPEEGQTTEAVKRDPQPCLFRLFGECLIAKPGEPRPGETGATKPEAAFTEPNDPAANFRLPGASNLGLTDLAQATPPASLPAKSQAPRDQQKKPANQAGGNGPLKDSAANQNDELLFPTEQELKEIKARTKGAGRSTRPVTAQPGVAVQSQTNAAADDNGSDVDAEGWAENGGWYQQDHAIFYRPAGHKDAFISSWLELTGPQSAKGDKSPLASIFDYLTSKDAQGSCAKCHSVDDRPGPGRRVNFTPLTVVAKEGRFTRFAHEPHFGIIGDRACLSCHDIDKSQPYLKSYEQGDPRVAASEFGPVKIERCQSCHAEAKARQDCLLCHTYHVNPPATPIARTKLPAE